MQTLGVPYEEGYDQQTVEDYMLQAQGIVDELKESGIEIEPQKQMVAMIAYMHKLGKDISIPEPLTATDSTTAEPLKEVELLTSEADLAEGKKMYDATCVVCHQADGSGLATFPSLIDDEWITGNSPSEVYNAIANGNVAKGMIPYKNQFSEKQIQQLTSYVLISLQEK
jgi:cytochrome c oxidase cbb3-type subunit I/II